MLINRLLCAGLLAALVASTASAQSLSGRFVDSNGVGVPNVNVILSNGAPLGTTDATGNFLISGLRNRVYTIQVDPHSDFLTAQQFDFSVSGAATLGTRVLTPAFPVSATMVGPTGAGLLGVNMNCYLLDGTKLFTPHDGSDAAGNVTIGVPANTPVRVRAVPPVGSGLVPFDQLLTATAPVALGTRTLKQGFVTTGSAVDAINSLPIAGAEVITTDMITGEVVLQLNKLTSATGAFSLLLPFGVYEVNIIPPLGNLHAAKQMMGLPILTQGFNLGLVPLQRGFALSGQVFGPSGAIAGADIDVYTADGYKLYTPNDNTSAAGVFSVVVPTGSHSVRVDPPVSYGVVGTRTANFNVATNTSIGVISLAPGVTMTGTVLDYNGQPVGNANIDFTNPSTGQKIVIAGDIANAQGQINGIVPLGNWDITIKAPQGSLAQELKFPNTPVIGPITTNAVLPRKHLMMDMKTFVKGIVLSASNGGVLPIDWSFQNPDAVDHLAIVDGGVELPSGDFQPWIPNIPFNFPANFGMLLQFDMPMPILPANQLGRIQKFMVRFKDPSTSAVVETAYINYVPL